jgi:hypothetical protein
VHEFEKLGDYRLEWSRFGRPNLPSRKPKFYFCLEEAGFVVAASLKGFAILLPIQPIRDPPDSSTLIDTGHSPTLFPYIFARCGTSI